MITNSQIDVIPILILDGKIRINSLFLIISTYMYVLCYARVFYHIIINYLYSLLSLTFRRTLFKYFIFVFHFNF
jgi:hypothetical protein